ncbi:unnamed protein product [Caenorhabditis sp. 36 PRJEB53466]|nr:unnamed protein product [Caenorhabditis sp. 36 PRJEB53466]
MIKQFRKPGALNYSTNVQRSVFLTFIWMQSANLLFYVLDNVVYRIPPSGLLTSWLAATSPAHFLKLSYYFLLISNYLSTSFSLLFCFTRFIVVYFPDSHTTKISHLFAFYIPISFILPFLLTLFFLPATVYCRQLIHPYSFGALYFNYVGAWHDIYYDPFNVSVNSLSTIAIIGINVGLLRKVRMMMKRKANRASRSLKAEISLTLMTLTMSIPFLSNAALTVTGVVDPLKSVYTLLPRQICSDIGLVAVPWIFYLTHPMFRSNFTVVVTMSQGSSGMRVRGPSELRIV